MPDFTAMTSRYQHLRQISKKLNLDLVHSLSRDMLLDGGRALGVLDRGIVAVNSPEIADLLMDYCLYNVRRGGLSAVERYLADHRPPDASDELFLLTAKTQARYSVFQVQDVVAQSGLQLLDMLNNEPLLLVDIGLSHTVRKGVSMVGRMIPLGDYWMTSGTGMALSETALHSIRSRLPALLGGKPPQQLPTERYDAFVAALIRCCLESDDLPRTVHADPHEWQAAQKRQTPWQPPTASRNEPCPCGSGRKYKNCCDK